MDNERFQELVLQQLKVLTEGQSNMENHLEKLEHKTDRIDSGLLKLETRIENEVIEKVRALFDARQVQEDKLGHISEKLDSIEIDTGYLVSRVARLEKVAK